MQLLAGLRRMGRRPGRNVVQDGHKVVRGLQIFKRVGTSDKPSIMGKFVNNSRTRPSSSFNILIRLIRSYNWLRTSNTLIYSWRQIPMIQSHHGYNSCIDETVNQGIVIVKSTFSTEIISYAAYHIPNFCMYIKFTRYIRVKILSASDVDFKARLAMKWRILAWVRVQGFAIWH